MNLSELILHTLAQAEVRQLFGVVGDAINPLVDAIRRDTRFEWIAVRHEEAGAFAASAQAKLTNRLAVCAGTVGPGAIHLLNGLYDAKKDNAPVLAITGQVPRDEVGSDFHQEVDLDALFSDVSVFNQTVNSPAQMPRLIVQAIESAMAKGGVAHISIPSDLAAAEVPDPKAEVLISPSSPETQPDEDELNRAAEILNANKRIAILCGYGCRGAAQELLSLAKRLQAPIVHTLRAKDIIDHHHPHWIGGTGLLGSTSGMHAIEDCDTLLMAGSDFPYRNWLPDNKPVIQIDVRADRIGRRCRVEAGVVGHVRPALRGLQDRVEPKEDAGFLRESQKQKAEWEQDMDEEAALDRDRKIIHPQAVARLAGELADDDAVFCCDTGEVTVWGARHLRLNGRQRFLLSFNLASMAFAMPGAIGVQALDRKRQVVSLSGDGGFSMLMGDLLTAINFDLPVKIIVFNNGKLGLVKMEMEVAGYPEFGTDLKNPDFAAIARICGAGGIRVSHPAELRDAMHEAFSTPGPFLLDVLVNGEELTMPPKIEPAQAWGYSLSKLKELTRSIIGYR